MFKIDDEIRGNDVRIYDVSKSPYESLTVQFGGEFVGASVQIFSIINGERVPVAYGGPFNETADRDQYDQAIRRVVIPGRADALSIEVSGGNSSRIKLGIR